MESFGQIEIHMLTNQKIVAKQKRYPTGNEILQEKVMCHLCLNIKVSTVV